MKVNYSKKFQDIEKRLAKIPSFTDRMFHSILKKHALEFVDQYQKNIKYNRLNIVPLHPQTINMKSEKGYPRPDSPLYGKGEDEKKSYSNMWFLRKIKKGWKAIPRWAKHHDSKLQLRELLRIHEYGCTIIVTPKMRMFLHSINIHLKKTTNMIRIPPRPVAFLTYREVLNEIKKKVSSQKIKRAINSYIQDATTKLLNEIFEQEKLGNEFTN